MYVCIVDAWGKKNRGVDESLSREDVSQDEVEKLEAVPYLVHQLGHQVRSICSSLLFSENVISSSFTSHSLRNDPPEYVD